MSVLAIGEIVGERYTVEAEIGRGGMQEVYRARDGILRRIVAVKVPQDARVARKFRDSSILSSKVNHPNVAKTLDYFEDSIGRFYMVEEYVEGLDLRKITSRFKFRADAHTVQTVVCLDRILKIITLRSGVKRVTSVVGGLLASNCTPDLGSRMTNS